MLIHGLNFPLKMGTNLYLTCLYTLMIALILNLDRDFTEQGDICTNNLMRRFNIVSCLVNKNLACKLSVLLI